MKLSPFTIEPREVPLIWGGDALVRRFGKHGDPDAAIGESWECWDENRVASGPLAGKRIAELRAEFGAELLGALDPARAFPVLTKLIDARQPLSVQVHPDDAYARRTEHQPNGKTECWYVLDAQADATLVLGWTRDTTREEYLARVRDGSLGELLRRVPVKAGDVFYLPAGTLHAIGAGIVLFEVQQTSALTYRIFDWNRMGADGKPRALHVDKAADVLDYRRSGNDALQQLAYERDGARRALLVADEHFAVERVEVGGSSAGFDLDERPLIVTALDAPLEARGGGASVPVRPYETVFFPAALGRAELRAADGATGGALAAIPLPPEGLARSLAEGRVANDALNAFLRQFRSLEAR